MPDALSRALISPQLAAKTHDMFMRIANAARADVPDGGWDDPYSKLETICEAMVEAGYLAPDYCDVYPFGRTDG